MTKEIKLWNVSLINRYQNNLESMKGSEFIFDCVQLLYYECYQTNPNCGGSNIDSSDWIKNKKTTINAINKKDDECFQYAVTVTLKHEEIKKISTKIIKIKSFIKKYIWERINFLWERGNWKKFQKCFPCYVSKNNSNRYKEVSDTALSCS